MIFAAGKGTRLGELGESTPKALLELNGHPLLYHILLKLKKNSINHVVINLMHLGDQIKKYVQSLDIDLKINFSYEEDLLETGGGLKAAAHFLSDSSQVVVHNGDIYSEIDLQLLVNENTRNERDVTLAVQDRDSSRKLLFNNENKLCGWKNFKTGEEIIINSEKALNEFAFSGIQCVSNNFLKQLTKFPKDKFSIIEYYLSLSHEKNKIFAADRTKDIWFDLGSPDKILKAKNYFA